MFFSSASPNSDPLHQAELPQARVAVAADDEVVVDGDIQRLGGRDNVLGHFDVARGRGRIARGMIVD